MKHFLFLVVIFLPAFLRAQAVMPDYSRDSAYIADSLRYVTQYKIDSAFYAQKKKQLELKKELQLKKLEMKMQEHKTMRWGILIAIPLGIAALVLLIIFLVKRFS